MPLPLVAVVGRPNVGKSTLVNRIAQTNDAIVHEMRGVTRDRSYHKADWNGVDFMLIDTGGIEAASDDDFQKSIRSQALEAAEQADVILMVVDGRVGMQADDEDVARILKKSAAPVLTVVNKMDNPGRDDDAWEFYGLGLGEFWPVSASHGHGTGDLLDEVVRLIRESQDERGTDVEDGDEPDIAKFADSEAPTEDGDDADAAMDVEVVDVKGYGEDDDAINVAIIGRPNAGKSSLTNRLTANDRSIVSPVSGTTRDAIDTLVRKGDTLYRIVDTAGLRRKSQIEEDVEYYGYVRAMRAIERADVAVLVVDASIGVTNEDQRVAAFAKERGCAMVIALNKWDIVDGAEAKEKVREQVADDLQFVSYAPVIAISAVTGKNVEAVWSAVDKAYAAFTCELPTSRLNRWLAEIQESGYSVTKGKAILRIKYVTQTGTRPPKLTFFCNRPDIVNDNYRRFLENRLRKAFDLEGTPVYFGFKKKD